MKKRLTSLLLTLALSASLTVVSVGLAPAGIAEAAGSKVFLGYWAKWGDASRPDDSLRANLGRIDLFSPYWYTLRSDGTLGSRESGHATISAMVQKAGQKVIPLINKSSSDAPLLDSGVRRQAVQNIYQMLVDNGYDGVNIDFEGMDASTRWGVTAFMQELSAKLKPAGLLVTMAVPAKWSADDSVNSFAACFDFAALGAAVDYLVIMTYDQHAGWSGPGPVAGADWTDKVIRYATTVVPKEKILLGLAGYGYDWSSSGTAEVDAWNAPAKATSAGVDLQWDDTAKVPHFTYWSSSGLRHDVWYENSDSVDFKIDQINRYGLGGAALWALGQEDSRFWQVVSGTAGWSGGLGAAESPAAGGNANAGGTPPGGGTSTGGPAGSNGSNAGALTFSDVPSTHWAYDAILRLATAEAAAGVDATHFRPDQLVSRAEFAALLVRYLDLPAPSDPVPSFGDVSTADWFYDAVVRAVGSGYMVGMSPSLFGPQSHVTRQQAAVIAARAGAGLPIRFDTASRHYSDAEAIATWAYAPVMGATYKGLISGYPDGTFRPTPDISRAEAAVIISRLKP